MLQCCLPIEYHVLTLVTYWITHPYLTGCRCSLAAWYLSKLVWLYQSSRDFDKIMGLDTPSSWYWPNRTLIKPRVGVTKPISPLTFIFLVYFGILSDVYLSNIMFIFDRCHCSCQSHFWMPLEEKSGFNKIIDIKTEKLTNRTSSESRIHAAVSLTDITQTRIDLRYNNIIVKEWNVITHPSNVNDSSVRTPFTLGYGCVITSNKEWRMWLTMHAAIPVHLC